MRTAHGDDMLCTGTIDYGEASYYDYGRNGVLDLELELVRLETED